MCPIAGIFPKDSHNVSGQMNSMLTKMYLSNSSDAWLATPTTIQRWEGAIPRRMPTTQNRQIIGQISFATKEDRQPERPCFDCQHQLLLLYEGNLYNCDELRSKLKRNHQLLAGTATEMVVRLLQERYKGNLEDALGKVIKDLDGVYTLAVGDESEFILLQDPIGGRPAYFAENDQCMAFASEKKALWEIGLRNAEPLRAGRMAVFKQDKVNIIEAMPILNMSISIKIDNMDSAVRKYQRVLCSAVDKRLTGLKRVGVFLSGGVDSCLLAKVVDELATKKGIQVTAYTAGLASSPDMDYAQSFARELGLRHRAARLDIDKVEAYIPEVVQAVEERDFVQIEAGIGVYAASEMAKQDDVKVIFSGQGPDEIWAGYTWYPEVVAREGYSGLKQRMWADLENGDIETLDRENKIAMTQGIEMMFPYLDMEVIRVAMSTSPELKVGDTAGDLGKHPHRQLAEKLGVPVEWAERPKKAAQHGTGIHGVLDGIARRNGFTPELVQSIGYTSGKVTKERLGSSSRYGYRFGEKELWTVPDHIQLFLDAAAHRNNLLNEAERAKINQFLDKIENEASNIH